MKNILPSAIFGMRGDAKNAFFLVLLTGCVIWGGAQVTYGDPAEVAATFDVDSFADAPDANPGNGSCASAQGECTLRAAIEEANVLPGLDTINLENGLYEIDSQLVVEDDVTFVGAGKDVSRIDGQESTPIFRVQNHELLVCDNGDHSVVGYDIHGNVNGNFIPPGQNGLENPSAIDVRLTDVYVTTWSDGVFQYDPFGKYEGLFVSPNGLGNGLFFGDGVFQNESPSDFYVADYLNNRVLRLDRISGALEDTLTSNSMSNPNSIAFYDGDVYVTDPTENKVLRYNGSNGNFIETFVDTFPAGLDRPRGILFKDDVLYVANEGNDSVLRFNANTGASLGTFVSSSSGGLDKPSDITFGPDGNFYVLSGQTDQVLRYNGTTGAFIDVFVEEDDVYLDHPSCIKWRSNYGVAGPRVTFEDLTIQNGQSMISGDTAGITIHDGSTVYLRRSAVRNNTSSQFGGGIQNWGNLSLFDSDVTGNALPIQTAGGQTSQGGGIFNAGLLTLGRVLIADNTSIRGAGISNTNFGVIEMTDSTVSGNEAYGGGAGIRNVANGTVRINHSTIVRNTIDIPQSGFEHFRFGAGIQTKNPARTFVANSIIAENTDGRSKFSDDYSPDCHSDAPGYFESKGTNLIGILTENCNYDSDASDMLGDADDPLDPMLGNLIDRVHMPDEDSPVVDAGDTTASIGGIPGLFFPYSCRYSDQNLVSRPLDGDANGTKACDLGAAELFNDSFVLDLDLAPGIPNGSKLDFGLISPGEIAEKTLRIKNTGNVPIDVEIPTITNGFGLAEPFKGATLKPDTALSLTIQFNAEKPGDYSGRMVFKVGSETVSLVLSGVREEDPTATPTNTAVPTSTAEPTGTAQPTGTAEPTSTPEPTNTPDPNATATSTPVPGETSTPAPTAEPSGTPAPPQTGDNLIFLPVIRN